VDDRRRLRPNHRDLQLHRLHPHDPTLDGFTKAGARSTEYTFATYLLNTFAIIVPKVIVTVISRYSWRSGFARFNVPGKRMLFALLIATIPCESVLPSAVPDVRELGWLDTFFPL